jgi:phytoene synthase
MIRHLLRRARLDLSEGPEERPSPSPEGASGLRPSYPTEPELRAAIRWLDPPEGPWTVEKSYAYCEGYARSHGETFPVASRFVPAELRPHLMALYAFARSADDFADEPEYDGRRSEALDRWEDHLRAAAHGEATHPVFVALSDTIERRGLPVPALEDLLTAYRMDLEVKRYGSFSALRGYTNKSAEPVGRLLLALFGYRHAELVRYADDISTALQLTNFWQDLAADIARDRFYVPAEDLHYFRVSEAELRALRPTEGTRALLRYQVARTRALFEKGRPLLGALGNDLKFELAIIWLMGMAILDKIEDADYDVFSRRIAVGKRDKAMVLARAAKRWAGQLDLSRLRRRWS